MGLDKVCKRSLGMEQGCSLGPLRSGPSPTQVLGVGGGSVGVKRGQGTEGRTSVSSGETPKEHCTQETMVLGLCRPGHTTTNSANNPNTSLTYLNIARDPGRSHHCIRGSEEAGIADPEKESTKGKREKQKRGKNTRIGSCILKDRKSMGQALPLTIPRGAAGQGRGGCWEKDAGAGSQKRRKHPYSAERVNRLKKKLECPRLHLRLRSMPSPQTPLHFWSEAAM
eukprot:RCo033287